MSKKLKESSIRSIRKGLKQSIKFALLSFLKRNYPDNIEELLEEANKEIRACSINQLIAWNLMLAWKNGYANAKERYETLK